MRLIRTVAAVGLLAAAATVTPTVGTGHAQALSPLCFDLNLNNPLRDGFYTLGVTPTMVSQGFAGETIIFSAGPPTRGTPTRTELRINNVLVASGGFPATLSYTLPTDGFHQPQWSVNTEVAATWSVSCTPASPDGDGDGVPDANDACAGTVLPDVPLVELKPNRVAADENGTFVDGKGQSAGVTLQDTDGCSAAQIIAVAGLGKGHSKFGISKGDLMEWVNQ